MAYQDTLFSVDDTPAGYKRITADDLFSCWVLVDRRDVPSPWGKPRYVDSCHAHTETIINDGDYVLWMVYDYGFGSCDLCRGKTKLNH